MGERQQPMLRLLTDRPPPAPHSVYCVLTNAKLTAQQPHLSDRPSASKDSRRFAASKGLISRSLDAPACPVLTCRAEHRAG